MIGKCAICGNEGELTFEHVPPQAAFNNKPIYIQLSDHLTERDSYVYGKKMKSNKGLGGYTLCVDCNNNTGAWYAKDYCEFAKQGMTFLTNGSNPLYVEGEYLIKPLNVFKQIVTMFMSTDKSGHLQSNHQLISFILNKESTYFPESFKIYMYSNASKYKRMMGPSVVYDPVLGIQKWSEINFKPFGFLLSENSGPAHEFMTDISSFGKFRYDAIYKVKLRTVYLKVSSPQLGTYQ